MEVIEADGNTQEKGYRQPYHRGGGNRWREKRVTDNQIRCEGVTDDQIMQRGGGNRRAHQKGGGLKTAISERTPL